MVERCYFVLGTRPEIVKLSSVIRAWQDRGLPFQIIHTGQHYSPEMAEMFFKELGLPSPDKNLSVGSGPHGVQTARILVGVWEALSASGPGIVVIEGDTNSTLGGALAGVQTSGAWVAHVEAGCRSFNRLMPEELNRIVVDHISDRLFAPTPADYQNLVREGLEPRALLVGSTGVEACLIHARTSGASSRCPEALGVQRGDYALATLHRQENTEDFRRLGSILQGLRRIAVRLPVVIPVHPRTARIFEEHRLRWPEGVRTVPPLGYTDFLATLANARLVLTDSGGIQEEAAYLGIRCFTLRDETEWTFTVAAGVNTLVGADADRISDAVESFVRDGARIRPVSPEWPQGRPPSEAIVEQLRRDCS